MMNELLTTGLYCQSVEARLVNFVVDQSNGEKCDLRDLFYPLRIDDGRYAFERYAERVHQSDSVHYASDNDTLSFLEASALIKERVQTKLGQGLKSKSLGSKDRTASVLLTSSVPSDIQSSFRQKNETESLAEQIKAKIKTGEAYITSLSQQNSLFNDGDPVLEIGDNTSISSTPDRHGSVTKQTTIDYLEKAAAYNKTISVESPDLFQMGKGTSDSLSDLLQNEEDKTKAGRLLWPACRVLALASAGCGKTTILNRLALFYSILHTRSSDDLDYARELNTLGPGTEYDLPWNKRTGIRPIPVLIRLRTLRDRNYSIYESIIHSVFEFVADSSYNMDIVSEWIESVRNQLLLLIDGLDEIPDGTRCDFLCALETYLNQNPGTMVLLSSRVAGLSENGVETKLKELCFHGRTIMPLSDKDTLSYCDRWINITQAESPFKEEYHHILHAIQTEDKYAFLRELMRTPLELTVMLQQIISNSVSPNKWKMFYDSLWRKITNHVDSDNKQNAFDDTMLFLGLIAYQLQKTQKLSITQSELSDMLPLFMHLNFQTAQFIQMTPASIFDRLDMMAASIGIIEKNDTGSLLEYTFPIRAYQEFLTAYACCHIRLNPDSLRPDPIGIIVPHVNESRWADVIGYAISDMDNNGSYELDGFEDAVFRRCNDAGILKSLVDDGFYVSSDKAGVICDSFFKFSSLSVEQKQLLITCLNTESAYSYRRSLSAVYRKAYTHNESEYLEALAYAHWIKAITENTDVIDCFLELLYSEKPYQHFIGAKGFSIIARTVMDEEPLKDYRKTDNHGKEQKGLLWFASFLECACDTVEKDKLEADAFYYAYKLCCLRKGETIRSRSEFNLVVRKTGYKLNNGKYQKATTPNSLKTVIDVRLIERLASCAQEYHSPIFIEALTELYLARLPGSERISEYLDDTLASIVRNKILETPVTVLCRRASSVAIQNTEFYQLRKFYYMLGTFPPVLGKVKTISAETSTWQTLLLDCYYEKSKDDVDIDQVAIVICGQYLGWTYDRVCTRWVSDICKCLPSSAIRKDHLTIRENNHFYLVKNKMKKIEAEYLEIIRSQYNGLLSNYTKTADWIQREKKTDAGIQSNSIFNSNTKALVTVTELSILQRIAADYYVSAGFGKEDSWIPASILCLDPKNMDSIVATNFAFLIRYGHLDVSTTGKDRASLLYWLLYPGVHRKEAYAVINLALFDIENGQYADAQKLMTTLSETDWQQVTRFWYDDMWIKRHAPEGALVCVMAQSYAGLIFNEYAEMLRLVEANFQFNQFALPS